MGTCMRISYRKGSESMATRKILDINPARVLVALAGEVDVDSLSSTERRLFDALLDAYFSGPTPEDEAFVAHMRADGGYVGDDDEGRLIRTLPGGGVEIIEETIPNQYSSNDIGPLEGLAPRQSRSRLTIIGGEGYASEHVDQLREMMEADPDLWFIKASRKEQELLIFRGPHP